MSYTEIYAITKKHNLIKIGEIKNSLLGCKWIWNKLLNKYFPNKVASLENYQLLWHLANSESNTLNLFEKVVLKSTFDYYICDNQQALALSHYLDEFNLFYSKFDENLKLSLNPNLKEQSEILLKKSKYNKYIRFVFNQTSINECLWKNVNLERYI